MVNYLIFLYEYEAVNLIQQIDSCMGYPQTGTTTYYGQPDLMCEYDSETNTKQEIGFGIQIKDFVYNCLTEEQKSNIIILPNNINTCISFTGTT